MLSAIHDGIGINSDENLIESDSFGYKLIRSFRNKMKGDLSVVSEKGTEVTLKINQYSKVA